MCRLRATCGSGRPRRRRTGRSGTPGASFGRLEPASASLSSTGARERRLLIVDSLDALITRTPTPLRRSSALSILTRSARCELIDCSAAGMSSSAALDRAVLLLQLDRQPVECSRSRGRCAALLASSWPMKTCSWVRTERTSSSRPPKALLSSSEMILSWPTPPPLSSSDRAPRTSSTSGLRPVRSERRSRRCRQLAGAGLVDRLAQRDELLAEEAGLPDLGAGVVRAGRRSPGSSTVTSAA